MNLNLNIFLMISAIVAALFGLGLVLAPGLMFSIYASHPVRRRFSASGCSARP